MSAITNIKGCNYAFESYHIALECPWFVVVGSWFKVGMYVFLYQFLGEKKCPINLCLVTTRIQY